MNRDFAPTALMTGNFVTGVALLAPTAMLGELSADLGVTIRAAALLITFAAVILCIGSPVSAWLTSRIERRRLLVTTVAIIALANLASAFASDYTGLLVIRLLMAAVAALYTPQAAGTVAMIVPVERRGSSIAYVFLGWTLAVAVGLPLVTFVASHYGWRAVYGGIGGLACLSGLLLAQRLPRGLTGVPVDLKTWIEVGRNRLILLLLLITTLQISGQFMIFTFMAPLLRQLTGAGPDAVSAVFAIYGVCGFLGISIATRIVDGWGGFRTSLMFTTVMLAGMIVWAVSAGDLHMMAFGVGVWGLGFGAINSMQQVRLVGAAPALASASVSLNTSVLYVGQAVGSGIGGVLYARSLLYEQGYAAVGFVVMALLVVVTTHHR